MPHGRANRDFELDVSGILGYQLLAISCSMSIEQGSLKRKAFEILHRSKQVGGDGAKCILLCALAAADARALLRDVEEDTGPHEKNFAIWGIDTWTNLTEHFEEYLTGPLGIKHVNQAKAVV